MSFQNAKKKKSEKVFAISYVFSEKLFVHFNLLRFRREKMNNEIECNQHYELK